MSPGRGRWVGGRRAPTPAGLKGAALTRAALFGAVALGAALVLVPRPIPAAGAATTPATATAACSTASGTHVALVIDFGPTVERACAAVPSDDDEAEALAILSKALGWPAPRYAGSGLLCAIEGEPEHGCGAPTAHGYAYWSSWQGGSSWIYSNGDPSTTTVAPATTIGWRFQPDGAGNPSDPPPRSPSSPLKVCVPTGPATRAPLTCDARISTSAPTSPPPTTTTTAPPGGSSQTTPASHPTTTSTTPGGSSASTLSPGVGASDATTTTAPPVAHGDQGRRSGTPGRRRGATGDASAGGPGGRRPAAGHVGALPTVAGGPRQAVTPLVGAHLAATGPASHEHAPATGGGDVTPYVVVAAALVLLGGGVLLSRRRRAARGGL